jgi:hypothetical protein
MMQDEGRSGVSDLPFRAWRQVVVDFVSVATSESGVAGLKSISALANEIPLEHKQR